VSVIDQIKTLSPTEAVMAMEALWEQLRSEEDELESPDWHREELERRDGMIQEGKAEFSPWGKAKERIRNRVRK
jgi:putative addiction module component (TIGR02574 family)